MSEQVQQHSALPSRAVHTDPRDPALEAAQRIKVCAEAKEWLGTKYHHQGFVKGVGVDCAFFLVCCYHAAGLIPWIDPRPYPPDWHMHRDGERYLHWVRQYCEQVESPQPGDLVVYKYGRTFSHGAIVLNWPEMIHSYIQLGVLYGNGEAGEFAVAKGGKPRLKEFYSPWIKGK